LRARISNPETPRWLRGEARCATLSIRRAGISFRFDSSQRPPKLGCMLIERLRKRLAADRASFIEPCLPSPAGKPPSGFNWIHEIKHDGYRLMARRNLARKFAIAARAVAAFLACFSGVAFGEIDCNERCGNDHKSGCYGRCRADRGAEQKGALRQIDPKLAAAVERRFRQIEEIEYCGDPQCPDISIYTPDRIWTCVVTRQPLRLRCRTRHQ